MIENLLSQCGLNASEQTVFLDLIERGQSIASLISKRTGLKRPLVYAVLNSLLQSGLVSKQKRSRVTYYIPLSLDMIPQILENRARTRFNEIQNATELIARELRQYEEGRKTDFAGFEIETMESVEAVYLQLQGELLGGDFDAVFNPQTAFPTDKAKKLVKAYLDETARSKPHIREIAVSGPDTEWLKRNIKNSNHQVKEVSADKLIFSDVIISERGVALLQYDPSREVGIKIVQDEFRKTMKTMFEMLWESI
jgi:sugar-specific transcriptional regulator TrmB